MAYNVPAYETDKFSFGPARLYAAAIGVTPKKIGPLSSDA